jgi:hypothetical protein
MALPGGPLNKLKFLAYTNSDYNELDSGLMFEVQFNPPELGFSHTIEYNNEQPQGTTDTQKSFRRTRPSGLNLSFTLDGTGAAGGPHLGVDVKNRIDEFFRVAMEYQGDTHRPRNLEVVYGKLTFRGVASSINVKYTLFAPDGRPLRALVDVRLSSATSFRRQVAENAPESADMTHLRTVREGERLDRLTWEVYKDPRYLLQVARANSLTNIRKLKTGQEIIFPPLEDKSENT